MASANVGFSDNIVQMLDADLADGQDAAPGVAVVE